MKLTSLLSSSILITIAGGIAIACSSVSDNNNTVDGACSTYASAYRKYLTKCSSGEGAVLSDPRWQTMEGRMKLACQSALSLPGTGIQPSQLAGCANALAEASCNTKADQIAACDFPPGSLADGAACTSSEQCKSESCVKVATSDGPTPSCGTCQPRVAIGGDCSTNSRCVDKAQCDFTTKKCIAIVYHGVGGTCDSTKGEQCESGLLCDYTTKTCKARATVGQPCSSSVPCETGLTCDSISKTCYQPTIAGGGQACGTAAKARCGSDLACDPTALKCVKITWVAPGGDCGVMFSSCLHGSCNSTTKKCPALIPDGGACLTDRSTGVCDDFASCIDGKCSLPGQVVCK
jgi:hypothetical protein